MADAIETFEVNGRTVTIDRDDDCASPREWDNLAHFVCWHRRANLGDETVREPLTARDVIRRVRNAGDRVLAILPLYIYEHGGITMRTGAFADRFDSGQVGWAYVTRKSAEKMGCTGPDWKRDRLEEAIRAEVSSYDDWLTGQCYGYTVTGAQGDVIDSCWGFVGDLDYVRSEARAAALAGDDPAADRVADELSERATYAGPVETSHVR